MVTMRENPEVPGCSCYWKSTTMEYRTSVVLTETFPELVRFSINCAHSNHAEQAKRLGYHD